MTRIGSQSINYAKKIIIPSGGEWTLIVPENPIIIFGVIKILIKTAQCQIAKKNT
ncbi:hypothetical protein FHS68_002660 [Dyadobacter arcticus]|uniref:Uncharacterized protein n=1 Tax=Dyadobacter arcticus TaxID=1078754 RepID=A0ABX0UPA0_9BACT|nr:hypothetical protein [Dyadobacter arcticus]